MPTYQYECQSCGHGFEEFQAITDKKLTQCPQCGKNKLARLIGAGAGMIFKGAGFYETDYKKKAAPASSDKKEPAKSAPAAAPAASGGCGGGCSCHPH